VQPSLKQDKWFLELIEYCKRETTIDQYTIARYYSYINRTHKAIGKQWVASIKQQIGDYEIVASLVRSIIIKESDRRTIPAQERLVETSKQPKTSSLDESIRSHRWYKDLMNYCKEYQTINEFTISQFYTLINRKHGNEGRAWVAQIKREIGDYATVGNEISLLLSNQHGIKVIFISELDPNIYKTSNNTPKIKYVKNKMGFFDELGGILGDLGGFVVSSPIKIVGGITGSDFIKEIGDGVEKATANTGKSLGKLAGGVWDIGAGVITQDSNQLETGFNDIGRVVETTIKGVGTAIEGVIENGANVIDGVLDNDPEAFKRGAKGLIKTAAIATLAISVIDVVDGVFVDDIDVAEAADSPEIHTYTEGGGLVTDIDHHGATDRTVENPNLHHVDPYWRHNADGTRTWVDGVADSNIHSTEGWTQSNPNLKGK